MKTTTWRVGVLMIARQRHLLQIDRGLAMFTVVAILGRRQVGKTTLARLDCQKVSRVGQQLTK